ncbi:MAG: ATP-dependent Clp protease adapter ClpS [Pseudomonadota bacterium]
MSRQDTGSQTEISIETRKKVAEPPLYRVLLHNDDYTSMDFVVDILVMVFRKTQGEATRIMLNVHQEGIGICGVYPYEVAETKIETVHSLAAENGYPLKCTMEKE